MNRLIETYLLHVKSHLPTSLRDDVAAEIEEGLHQKIEAQESELGRSINDDELNEILTEWGHPVQVAGQYLPHQYLIGPLTYPAYWHALKALAVVFGAILVLKLIVVSATGNLGGIAPTFGNTLWGLIAWAGILTAVFAIMDAKGVRFFSHFDARNLPERHAPSPHTPAQPITRFQSAFGIIFLGAILLGWCNAFGISLTPWNPDAAELPILGYEIGLGGNAESFFYPVTIVLVGGILLWGRCFLRPYWTRPSVTAQLILTLAEIAVLGALLRTPDVITLTVQEGAFNPEGLTALIPVIVAGVRILAVIVIIAKAFGVLGGALRLLRNRV